MKKCIFSMIVSWVLLAMTMTSVFASDGVDWENQKVVVTGMGIAPPTAVNAAQARMLARRAAVVDGYRQMAEQINGVQVDAESTVENMMILSDIVRTKVSACIKGARVLDEQILPDGSYAVRMEVPLFGSSNSLAAAVLQRPTMRQPFPAPSPEEDETFPAYSSVHMDIRIDTNTQDYYTGNGSRISYAATSFPKDQIPRIPSYAAVQQPQYSKEMSQGKSSKQREPITGDYTSLVVDCTGFGLCPAMSPVIKNEKGEAIYGVNNLDYDLVSTRGMTAYWRDLDVSGVARAGSKPLVVKCVSLSDNNINPVLTVADANRVLLENEQSHFLDKLNVILIR